MRQGRERSCMKRSGKRKIRARVRKIAGLLLIAVGLCFYLYPVINDWIFEYRSALAIRKFQETYGVTDSGTGEPAMEAANVGKADGEDADSVSEEDMEEEETIYPAKVTDGGTVTQEELDTLYKACFAYNCRIYAAAQSGLSDVESYEAVDLGEEAMEILEDGLFGYIEIPAMDVTLPLYLGASSENMAAGAAVLGETSLPIGGLNTNAVISGHRGYRGSPYFREIELLAVGDVVYVTNPWGTLTYVVTGIDIINPSDADAVKIQEGRDMITLLTCHPYRSGGKYRYVVYCDRLVEDSMEDSGSEEQTAVTGTIPAVGAEDGDYIIASDGTAYASSEKDIRTEQLLRRTGGIFLLGLFCFFLVRAAIYRILARRRRRRRMIRDGTD